MVVATTRMLLTRLNPLITLFFFKLAQKLQVLAHIWDILLLQQFK